ncbi:MAG: small nucleolar ribonucleoprotein [Thermoproteota archaeon]|nr:small nucleolar ribonucleoprotein [Thermoproteota archaeon]
MILITTSHRPTQRIRSLCKDLNRVLPGTIRINRGKLSIRCLAEKAIEYKADRVIIIDRRQGGPGRIQFYKNVFGQLELTSPNIYLKRVKLQEELGQKTFIRGSMVVTSSWNSEKKIKELAFQLSNFFRIPYLENFDNSDFKASIHVSPLSEYETEISFKMPPKAKEVGPTLIVQYSPRQETQEGK